MAASSRLHMAVISLAALNCKLKLLSGKILIHMDTVKL